jgi:hypothetical protein
MELASRNSNSAFAMSTFTVAGFFGLTAGQRVRTEVPRSNGTSQGVYHIHYVTSVNTSQSGAVPAELRKYSPPHDSVLQDDTIAFVVAKAYVPMGKTTGNVLLEASHIFPVPGDPRSPEYEERVPDFCCPYIFAQGICTGEHTEKDGGIVTFPVTVSDYIRGSTKQSTLQYVNGLMLSLIC